MNRIDLLFKRKQNDILSVYFTAGHPEINSLAEILPALENAGVDLIEIGMPFSDPIADGPVIQKSSQTAISNGMSLKVLFEQLRNIEFNIPVILMGYLNPILQYGIENFLISCKEANVSGTIIPDLPLSQYLIQEETFIRNNIHNILLITPLSTDRRITDLAEKSRGFLYAVASSATTGSSSFHNADTSYFERIRSLNLKIPIIFGFGISCHADFIKACDWGSGAIIGSGFIKHLEHIESRKMDYTRTIADFVCRIKYGNSIQK
ncbi:MAG: tryptophan synthase subunit alpha [Bacteroidetes bacterium]|nr:tryptophan synthase subunit alpha [Bacteroidota bacterium]